MKEKLRFAKTVEISNKKVRHDYDVLMELTAGMVLQGSEIKSIREGNVSLAEAYCYFFEEALHVKNMYIAPYKEASFNPPDPRRTRKLLIRNQEYKKWKSKMEEKELTIVPLRLFLNAKGWAKLEIALARGKKNYDKREAIKKRDTFIALNRLKKRYVKGFR